MKNVLMHITAQRVGERSEILKQLSSTSWLHLSAVLMKGGGASWRRGKQNNTEGTTQAKALEQKGAWRVGGMASQAPVEGQREEGEGRSLAVSVSRSLLVFITLSLILLIATTAFSSAICQVLYIHHLGLYQVPLSSSFFVGQNLDPQKLTFPRTPIKNSRAGVPI